MSLTVEARGILGMVGVISRELDVKKMYEWIYKLISFVVMCSKDEPMWFLYIYLYFYTLSRFVAFNTFSAARNLSVFLNLVLKTVRFTRARCARLLLRKATCLQFSLLIAKAFLIIPILNMRQFTHNPLLRFLLSFRLPNPFALLSCTLASPVYSTLRSHGLKIVSRFLHKHILLKPFITPRVLLIHACLKTSNIFLLLLKMSFSIPRLLRINLLTPTPLLCELYSQCKIRMLCTVRLIYSHLLMSYSISRFVRCVSMSTPTLLLCTFDSQCILCMLCTVRLIYSHLLMADGSKTVTTQLLIIIYVFHCLK